VAWTTFNMPATIAQGAASLSFGYDAEHNRVKKVSAAGTQLYLDGPGLRTERLSGAGGLVTWTDYLPGGDGMSGQRVSRSDGQNFVRYFVKDHLGSIAVITDEAGAVAERLSYDPWGKRRNPNGTDDPAGALTSQASRGFTGHEMLDDVDLVHMNGRVYDPLLGRFLSADPFVQYPASTQGWNRYAYVDNNPLARVDPSGYGWFSKAIKSVTRAFKNPVVRAVTAVAVAYFTGYYDFGSATAGHSYGILGTSSVGISNAVVGGSLGGFVSSGTLKGAAIGGITSAAFFQVGTWTGFHGAGIEKFATADHFANIAGHALVGCASTAAQGGSCGSGALAAGFGAAVAPTVAGLGDVRGLVVTSIIGGTASVLGGGKFENGAVTAAFGYMFNQAAAAMAAPVAGAGAAVGGLAGAAVGSLSGDANYDLTFYHGTNADSALALLNGAPLSADMAAANKIDGPPGFYLATNQGDAEFFAARRGAGAVLQYDMSDTAVRALTASGATITPIPRGPNSPFFGGSQMLVPPNAFNTFDQLRGAGQIRVTPAR